MWSSVQQQRQPYLRGDGDARAAAGKRGVVPTTADDDDDGQGAWVHSAGRHGRARQKLKNIVDLSAEQVNEIGFLYGTKSADVGRALQDGKTIECRGRRRHSWQWHPATSGETGPAGAADPSPFSHSCVCRRSAWGPSGCGGVVLDRSLRPAVRFCATHNHHLENRNLGRNRTPKPPPMPFPLKIAILTTSQ